MAYAIIRFSTQTLNFSKIFSEYLNNPAKPFIISNPQYFKSVTGNVQKDNILNLYNLDDVVELSK